MNKKVKAKKEKAGLILLRLKAIVQVRKKV